MKLRTVLATALLGCTLTAPLALAAGPRTTGQPPPTPTAFSDDERFCYDYGRFVYNHTLNRDAGISLWEALSASDQWDRAHGAPQGAQRLHHDAIEFVYHFADRGPADMRNQAEIICMKILTTPAPAGTPAR